MKIRTLLQHWTRHVEPDGSLFVHRKGAARGSIRVRDRVPLRSLDEWIADLRSSSPGQTQVTDSVVLDTIEGEHASLATLRVEQDGTASEHTIGVVFGDDWCFVVEATTSDVLSFREMRAAARTITENTFLGLGAMRRRRYLHVAPAGWSAERRPRAMHYRLPDCDDTEGLIIVDDALPLGLSLEEEAERTYVLGGDAPRESDEPATAVKLADGLLNGLVRWYRVRTPNGTQIAARADLDDGRFLYRQHLFGPEEREPVLVEAFLEVVSSARPLPRPRSHGPAPMFVVD